MGSYLQNTFIDSTPTQHSHKPTVQHLLVVTFLKLCPKVKVRCYSYKKQEMTSCTTLCRTEIKRGGKGKEVQADQTIQSQNYNHFCSSCNVIWHLLNSLNIGIEHI